MNPRTIGLAVVTLLSILACGGMGTTTEPTTSTPATPATPAPAPVSPLVAPWSTLGLPVGNGEIVENTSQKLLITYTDYTGGGPQLTSDWQLALTKAGYVASETVDTGDANISAIVYKTTTTALGLATGTDDGVPFAYMEDITAGGASVVRSGGRAGAGARRRARAGGGAPPAAAAPPTTEPAAGTAPAGGRMGGGGPGARGPGGKPPKEH